MDSKPFSSRLEAWAKGRQPKNLATLIETFGDKSFAVIMFLFMLFPSLPVPTAAHIFEAIAIIIAAQMVLGLKALWIPRFLSERIKLERIVKSKTMDKLISKLRWVETKSGPYGRHLFHMPLIDRMLGLVIITFAVAAFMSPPFSGLDTLPSLGVVFISLSILLENVVLLVIGLLAGTAGVVLSFFLASVVLQLLGRFF